MAEAPSRPRWEQFLAVFEADLDVLAGQMDMMGAQALLKVQYEPSREIAASGEILVGIGRWATLDASGQVVPVAHEGICLQIKGAPSYTGRRFASLAEFVTTAEDELWQDWTTKAGTARTPRGVLERFTLVVEDVSPDSCFGFICFLARVSGVPRSEIPAEWTEYASRWERGDVHSTGEPFASWGALHTALGHCYVEGTSGSGNSENAAYEARLGEALGRAWLACLRFDVAVLRSGAPAHDLSHIRFSPEHMMATAFLNYEYQQYLQGLQHALCVQLLLPMRGAGLRYKLVDGYFEDEQIPLGAKKVFLRNDREHTWLKDGFALMGLYKPGEKGSGNDMTVSVDPATGVHLEELWRDLELLEDEQWGNTRPSDRPRLGIKGYPDGRRADGRNAPNQPWYDEGGRYTLIAAPKKLAGDVLGSKLSWRVVRDAVWRLYNPMRFLRVKALNGTECSAEALGGCVCTPPGKRRLLIATWIREEPEQQPLLLSPTAKRYFAAYTARSEKAKGALSIEELPDEASFDFLTLPGGLAVVHRDGVFLLDDWRDERLNIEEVRDEFDRVSVRLHAVEVVQRDLDVLVPEIGRLVSGEGHPSQSEFEYVNALSELKIRIQMCLADTAPHCSDPAVLGFREVLERRWGVASKLEKFEEAVARIETALRDYSEGRTNRMINWLAIYGFPSLVLVEFFQFVTNGVPTQLHVGGGIWNLTFWGVHWLGLVAYIVLAGIGTVLLGVLMRRLRLRRRPVAWK